MTNAYDNWVRRNSPPGAKIYQRSKNRNNASGSNRAYEGDSGISHYYYTDSHRNSYSDSSSDCGSGSSYDSGTCAND